MALIDDVKKRLKIYYYDPVKDAEIQSYIDEAIAYLKSAGAQDYHFVVGAEDPLALGAIALYTKMAINADPKAMHRNPVFQSMVNNLKYMPGEAEGGGNAVSDVQGESLP